MRLVISSIVEVIHNVSRQLFLFTPSTVTKKAAESEIRILTWNISNPSLSRACKQLEWLASTKANVIILTEARRSEGCTFLRDGLENMGFSVFFPALAHDKYCVLMAEKGFSGKARPLGLSFLPERIQAVRLPTFLGELTVVGMYVPSRGPRERRNVDKRRFQNQIISLLTSMYKSGTTNSLVAGGDLNVIPPDHEPSYSIFGDWEYQFYNAFLKAGLIDAYKLVNPGGQEHSWLGRQGDGYRFDHLFLSHGLSSNVHGCGYCHEPRISELSDHSALHLCLKKPAGPA